MVIIGLIVLPSEGILVALDHIARTENKYAYYIISNFK